MSNILVWREFEHMNSVFAARQGFSQDAFWLKYTEVMIKPSDKIVTVGAAASVNAFHEDE